jgi:hypothetical protein
MLSFLLALQATAQQETRSQLKAREREMRSDYFGAIVLYEKDRQHDNAKVARLSLEGIARCYRALSEFDKAESAYQLLAAKAKDAATLCRYAEILLHNKKYAEAKQKANEAKKADPAYAEQTQRIIDACNNAVQWTKKPTKHQVTNLSDVNTCYSEWGAMPYSTRELVFCSDRPGENPSCTGKRQHVGYLLRAFTATKSTKDSALSWIAPKLLPSPINRKGMQSGPFGMARMDTTLFFYTCTGRKGEVKTIKMGKEKVRIVTENLEIRAVGRTDGKWDEYVVSFDYDNHSVMHPCLSANGDTLYFVSDMPGGQGGMDLWCCVRQPADKRWGAPFNLGTPVNTPGNEVFPTIDPAGTLYFSSDRHPGMGGLDIFYSKRVKGKWTPPKNMRAPINSSADDYSYMVDAFSENLLGKADTLGYFSSNRPGGKGSDDIYMFRIPGPKISKSQLLPDPDEEEPDEEEPETLVAAADTILVVDSLTGATITTIRTTTTTTTTTAAAAAAAAAAADSAAAAGPAAAVAGAGGLRTLPPATAADAEKMATEKRQISFLGKVVDKDTRNPVPNAKICVTHDATRTSECKECGKDGTFSFALKKDARYTIAGFKERYRSTDPIRILSTVFLEEEETVIEMTSKKEFSSAREVIDRSERPRNRMKVLPREYRIQILTNWEETDWEYFTMLRQTYPQFDLQYTRRNDGTGLATRFTYGSFVRIEEARKLLRQFIRLGYTDAFITVFEYDKQVESIYVSGSRHVINAVR